MQLFHTLYDIRNTLPDSYFYSLVTSMPKRARTVREQRVDQRSIDCSANFIFRLYFP